MALLHDGHTILIYRKGTSEKGVATVQNIQADYVAGNRPSETFLKALTPAGLNVRDLQTMRLLTLSRELFQEQEIMRQDSEGYSCLRLGVGT